MARFQRSILFIALACAAAVDTCAAASASASDDALAALKKEGTADGSIAAGLVAAGVPVSADVLFPALSFALPAAAGKFVQGNINSQVFDISTTAFANEHGSVTTMDFGGSSVSAMTNHDFVILKIAPCSYLMPHYHPLATETEYTLAGNVTSILLPLQGPTLDGTIPPPVSLVKTAPVGSLAFYPQGLLHTQINTGCDEAVLFVIFDAYNGGFQFVPSSQYAFPESLTKALGYSAEQAASAGKPMPVFGPLDPSGCQKC